MTDRRDPDRRQLASEIASGIDTRLTLLTWIVGAPGGRASEPTFHVRSREATLDLEAFPSISPVSFSVRAVR